MGISFVTVFFAFFPHPSEMSYWAGKCAVGDKVEDSNFETPKAKACYSHYIASCSIHRILWTKRRYFFQTLFNHAAYIVIFFVSSQGALSLEVQNRGFR